jgi:shikimate kinase
MNSAVGKTSFGRLVASALRWPFIDIDAKIEHELKCSIKEYMATRTWPEFRAIELKVGLCDN